MTNKELSRQIAGVVGFFDGPAALLAAAEKTRDANFSSFDVFSPFPVHGMDDAQGLKRSKLPFVTFACALAGLCCAFTLQYWTSAVDWPLNVGGKPFNSWPAFVPIMFELTVLFGGLGTLVGMLVMNRLPNTSKKIPDPSLTADRFAVMIENQVGKKGAKAFSEDEAKKFLQSIGAKDVRAVAAEGWF